MRVTQYNHYNRFISDQQSIKNELERLSRQISSGKKIKNGFEDPQVFADSLRLDYEETTLTQAIEVSKDAQNFANNTDSVMYQFTEGLIRFKTLLIQAANGTNAESNYFAISNELKSLKQHFIDLGNSSINGRFLFSGNKLDVKPLDDTGNYYGNGEELKAVVGAGVEVPYNIPGKELFFGEDNNVNRTVTTNSALTTQDNEPAAPDTTIREITGNSGAVTVTIQGRKGTGEYISANVSLNADESVRDLLEAIENSYGSDMVDVRIVNGYIQVRDKSEGRSHLDFHISGTDAKFNLVKSPGVNAATYDGVPFYQIGKGKFRGNMPQIVKSDNSFATASTKLQDTSAVDLTGGRQLNIDVNGTTTSFSIDETTTYGQLFEAIKNAVQNRTGNPAKVALDHDGRLVVESEGLTSFSLADSASPSVLFNTNNALTVDDPKHDFFASIDAAIEAVEHGLTYPDGDQAAVARNPGIENAVARIEHLIDHTSKEHTKVGAMSNSLRYAVDRSQTIRVNVKALRSEILDTDIGEATMKLNQLTLNFQALMTSVSKIQNLSLVNYM